MLRKTFIAAIGAAIIGLTASIPGAQAAGGGKITTQSWSWEGLFGRYDKAQLQRGYLIYKDVCASCHGMRLIAFRNLTEIGLDEDLVKEIAAEYEVVDGPDDDGEMFERAATPADYFPSPYANDKEAVAINGALPPDLSLINKARMGGPNYVYSFLMGFKDEPPEGKEIADGAYWNDAFGGGVRMSPMIYDEMVDYEDGTPMTAEQHAKDITAFLNWASEPELDERKDLGVKTLLFLIILSAMLFALKKSIWRRVDH